MGWVIIQFSMLRHGAPKTCHGRVPSRGSRRWPLAGFVLFLACWSHGEGVPYSLPEFPYDKQGPFVMIPARIASMPVAQVGFMAGALVCLPASLIQDQRAHGQVAHDREASIVCGKDLGLVLGWPVYAAVGLPFFILK